VQAHGCPDVVSRAMALFHLVEEPETLLREGERKFGSTAARERQYLQPSLPLISFIPESCGDFPRCLTERLRNVSVFPLVPNARIDPVVAVKLYVAEHPRFRVNAIRHAPLSIFVRLQHIGVKAEPEEPAQTLDHWLRLLEQIFKLQPVLSFVRDVLKKL